MKLWWEKDRQQAVGLLLICLFIFMGIVIINNFFIYRNYCRQVNTVITQMILEIEQQYPKVEEQELIHILNQNHQNRKKDLSDFGISDNEVNVIKSMETVFYYSLVMSISILIFFGVLAILILFFYFFKENKKMGEIIAYIHAINQRHYDLCLFDNEEGVISRLKNELYKITVMLKEQAEKSKKEKEAMKESLADISHQMKTPMTSVLVLIDNLMENEEMPIELRRKFLMEISHQIRWVNSLIISLLKLSRFSAGVVEMKREQIFLYDFFEEVRKSLLIPAEIRNVKVHIQKNQEISFFGDRYWEREAMTNLLKNAIEHTLENGNVKIYFEENYFFTRIFIEDEGTGIDPEEQKRIFERFYRGEYTGNGVGIGLSLAKKIIENDYGKIKVNSQNGKGTIFEIRY